jgi:hypothetical protein
MSSMQRVIARMALTGIAGRALHRSYFLGDFAGRLAPSDPDPDPDPRARGSHIFKHLKNPGPHRRF